MANLSRRAVSATISLTGLVLLVPAGGVAAALLAMRALGLVHQVTDIETAVELAVAAVGTVVAAWLATSGLVAVACAAARLAGHSWRHGEQLLRRAAPQIVRRGLALTVGAGIGLAGVTGANAVDQPPTGTEHVVAEAHGPQTDTGLPHTVADLGWRVSEPAGDTDTPAPKSHPADHGHGASTVTVRPGDTLWSIARDHLGGEPTAEEISRAWPRWYEANRATIGADPDVIVPGQTLRTPQDPQ